MATQAGPASWPNGQPELALNEHVIAPDHCLVSIESSPADDFHHPAHRELHPVRASEKRLTLNVSNCDCVDS